MPGFNLLSKQQEVNKPMATIAKRLKYLGVEMLKKDATKSSKPEIGLFRGLRTRTDGEGANAKVLRMIILGTKDKENDIRALNMEVFNVLSLKMLYGDTKELIVFKCSEADQLKAKQLLEVALEEFQKEKRMVDNDPEIVDVKTFEDVPKEFFAEVKKTTTTGAPGVGGSYGNMYSHCNYQQGSDWKKKEEERKEQKALEDKMRQTPTLIHRGNKDDLPAVKVLNAIKKKIASIAGGDYENELVDPDPGDTFVDGKKSSTAV
jgi:hypothetical protein